MNFEDLKPQFTHFKHTLDYIMDYERDSDTLFSKATIEDVNTKIKVKEDAPRLYMLIH
jgi:hypothetical protein